MAVKRRVSSGAWVAIALVALASSEVQAASFIPLGSLSNGDSASNAYDVSGDGTVVVGDSTITSSLVVPPIAFRWTAAEDRQGLGGLPDGATSTAYGVSADGSTVVGQLSNPSAGGAFGFRWTSAGGLEEISGTTYAASVSADGGVVVGNRRSSGQDEAYAWTATGGVVGLGYLPSYNRDSYARGVSDDGNVVVGYSVDSIGAAAAFRWTIADGMVPLGHLSVDSGYTIAHDVSADGSVIVGMSRNASGWFEAYRWTASGGLVGLGDLPGDDSYSQALGVSGDGSVVVGTSAGDTTEAFVWTASSGMQRLFDVLVANGAAGLEGWTLNVAYSISTNGQWVVGSGKAPDGSFQGFVANIAPVPVPAAGWLFLGAGAVLGAFTRAAA